VRSSKWPGAILALLLTQPAVAHEAWLLKPREMYALYEQPLSAVWRDVSLLSIVTASLLLVGLVLAEYLDRRFQPFEQILDRRHQEPARHWALLILRISLGMLLIASALGLNTREGTALFAEPTLFVPDLELSAVSNLVSVIAGIELILGVALVLGIYVNFCSLLVIVLVALGFFWFGPQIMLSYAGHILAPAFILLVEERDRFEHVTSRDSLPEQFVQRLLPFMTLERNLILMRVVTGLTFIYLAVMHKYLNSPHLEQIIAQRDVPTFGISPGPLVFFMAATELVCGFALVVGIAERIVAIVLIVAIFFFALVLGESVVMHANILGILIAIIFLGPGYMHADRSITPSRKQLGLAASRVTGAAALCAVIGASGLWVERLRAFLPHADARLAYVKAAPDMQPRISDVIIEPLGSGFYRIEVETINFRFTRDHFGFQRDSYRAMDGMFQGHAHIHAGEGKRFVLEGPVGVFGPVGADTRQLFVSLMSPRHRFLANADGLFAREVTLPDRGQVLTARPAAEARGSRASEASADDDNGGHGG
jgi:uncharacterized membrane protein YphA (DoxX/SURF4 family)